MPQTRVWVVFLLPINSVTLAQSLCLSVLHFSGLRNKRPLPFHLRCVSLWFWWDVSVPSLSNLLGSCGSLQCQQTSVCLQTSPHNCTLMSSPQKGTVLFCPDQRKHQAKVHFSLHFSRTLGLLPSMAGLFSANSLPISATYLEDGWPHHSKRTL